MKFEKRIRKAFDDLRKEGYTAYLNIPEYGKAEIDNRIMKKTGFSLDQLEKYAFVSEIDSKKPNGLEYESSFSVLFKGDNLEFARIFRKYDLRITIDSKYNFVRIGSPTIHSSEAAYSQSIRDLDILWKLINIGRKNCKSSINEIIDRNEPDLEEMSKSQDFCFSKYFFYRCVQDVNEYYNEQVEGFHLYLEFSEIDCEFPSGREYLFNVFKRRKIDRLIQKSEFENHKTKC